MTTGGSSGGAAAAVASGDAVRRRLRPSRQRPQPRRHVLASRPAHYPGDDPVRRRLLQPPAGPRPDRPLRRRRRPATGRHARPRPGTPASPPRRAAATPPAPSSVQGLRIAWSPDLGGLPVEPRVAQVLARARQTLTAAGARTVDAEPRLTDADEVFQVLRAVMMARRFGPQLETRDQLKDTLIGNIEKGLALTGPQVAAAQRRHSEIFSRTSAFLRPMTSSPPRPCR